MTPRLVSSRRFAGPLGRLFVGEVYACDRERACEARNQPMSAILVLNRSPE